MDEYEAHIVRTLYELYATGAYSIDLLRIKVKTDYGLNWAKGYVWKMLRNHFFYGIMIVKGKSYPHRYPTIITQALFDQVQQIKEGFNKKPVKFAGLPFMYRGLIHCEACGCAITPEKHKGRVYYHCTQYNGKHGAKWLREEKITEQLGQVFKNLQMPKDISLQIIETLNAVHEDKVAFHEKEFDKLMAEQKMTTKMIDNLYLDKLKGRITDSEYDRFYTSFREQITDISIRLEKLQEAEDNYYVTAKYLLDLANRAFDLFMSSEVDEKRQLIKFVLSNLRLDDKKLLWDVEKPFDLILICSDRLVQPTLIQAFKLGKLRRTVFEVAN